jgi:hypothetical protein
MNLRKVRVRMPQAQSGLEIKMKAGLGFNANQLSWPVMAGEFSEPDIEERGTLQPVDRDEANLEAEVGETAVTNLNADGIPEQYKIGGKRHYDGGTPLNLPDNSFIFSRDNSMKISDPDILAQFGITNFPKGGVTPADIAKKYNLNKYKKVLLDKNSDDLSRSTAEMMIANYTLKLGKLALVQESMKSFPGGIPLIAAPYLESIGLKPDEILPSKEQVEEEVQAQPEDPEADMSYGKYGLVKHQTPPGSTGSKLTIIKDPNTGEFVYAEGLDKAAGTYTKIYPKDYVPAGGKTASEQLKNNTAGSSAGARTTASSGAGKGVTVNVMPKPVLPKPPLGQETRTADYDPRLGTYNNKFNKLTTALSDKDARATFVSQYRAGIEKAKKPSRYSDKQWKEVKEKWLNMTDDQIVTNFLEKQRINYAGRVYKDANASLDGSKGQYNIITDNYDGKWDDASNNTYKEVARKLGFSDDEINAVDIGSAQAAYDAIRVTAQMPEYKDGVFKGFVPASLGPAGGNKAGTATGQMINDNLVGGNRTTTYDGVAGDNDFQQYAWFEDEPQPEVKNEKEKEEELDKIEKQEFKQKPIEDKTPWWMQDIIKTTGAAMDYMGVKKYMPWQATPAVDYMEPTFYSPERELAANAEQLAIGADGAAAFGSPQAFNARFSQMAGKTAENAANILGRYNNLNVGVANEAEKFNVETFNQYADQRAQDATNLYDKVTIANQQFDNSKNMARQNMRQSYIDAITNRAQTQALNTLFTDFYTDPSTGGFVRENINQRPIKPIKQTNDTAIDDYMKIYERIPGTPAEKNAAANTIYKNMYGTDASGKVNKKTGTDDDTYDDDLDRRMKYLEAMTKSRPGFNVYTNNTQ